MVIFRKCCTEDETCVDRYVIPGQTGFTLHVPERAIADDLPPGDGVGKIEADPHPLNDLFGGEILFAYAGVPTGILPLAGGTTHFGSGAGPGTTGVDYYNVSSNSVRLNRYLSFPNSESYGHPLEPLGAVTIPKIEGRVRADLVVGGLFDPYGTFETEEPPCTRTWCTADQSDVIDIETQYGMQSTDPDFSFSYVFDRIPTSVHEPIINRRILKQVMVINHLNDDALQPGWVWVYYNDAIGYEAAPLINQPLSSFNLPAKVSDANGDYAAPVPWYMDALNGTPVTNATAQAPHWLWTGLSPGINKQHHQRHADTNPLRSEDETSAGPVTGRRIRERFWVTPCLSFSDGTVSLRPEMNLIVEPLMDGAFIEFTPTYDPIIRSSEAHMPIGVTDIPGISRPKTGPPADTRLFSTLTGGWIKRIKFDTNLVEMTVTDNEDACCAWVQQYSGYTFNQPTFGDPPEAADTVETITPVWPAPDFRLGGGSVGINFSIHPNFLGTQNVNYVATVANHQVGSPGAQTPINTRPENIVVSTGTSHQATIPAEDWLDPFAGGFDFDMPPVAMETVEDIRSTNRYYDTGNGIVQAILGETPTKNIFNADFTSTVTIPSESELI